MPVFNQIVGQKVRLEAQLDDAATGKIVRCTLRNHLDAFITDIYLSEVEKGLYVDESYQMPDIPRVTAQFCVLTAGLSLDPDYSVELDDFIRTDPISVKSAGADVEATVDQILDLGAEVERAEQSVRVDAEPSVTVTTSDVRVRSELSEDITAETSAQIAVPAATC